MKDFTAQSSYGDFVDFLKREKVCSKALAWAEQHSHLSFEDSMVEHYLKEEDADVSWALFVLVKYYSKLDDRLRELYIQKIKHPKQAFALYLLIAELTDKDDVLLEAIFKGKAPRVEMELEQGVVKRAKGA